MCTVGVVWLLWYPQHTVVESTENFYCQLCTTLFFAMFPFQYDVFFDNRQHKRIKLYLISK